MAYDDRWSLYTKIWHPLQQPPVVQTTALIPGICLKDNWISILVHRESLLR